MLLVIQILAVGAALLHVYFFHLESIAWSKPSTWKTFGLRSQDEAETTRGLALNQGYYNLFLAIGVLVGVGLQVTGAESAEWTTAWTSFSDSAGGMPSSYAQNYWGDAFIVFGLSCMLGAAVVLVVSSKGKMLRGALVQGVLPFAALATYAISQAQ